MSYTMKTVDWVTDPAKRSIDKRPIVGRVFVQHDNADGVSIIWSSDGVAIHAALMAGDTIRLPDVPINVDGDTLVQAIEAGKKIMDAPVIARFAFNAALLNSLLDGFAPSGGMHPIVIEIREYTSEPEDGQIDGILLTVADEGRWGAVMSIAPDVAVMHNAFSPFPAPEPPQDDEEPF